MTLKLRMPELDMKPRIIVFGVGGAGGNAVNNMIKAQLEGVDFWVGNTDAQALEHSHTKNRLQLGFQTTHGLGAGSHPEVGKQAAEESLEDINNILENCHMLFITAGLGGGSGTGGAPVIARAAKEKGILTVCVVTKPFHFEGARRMKTAELGLEELKKYADTVIVIPNQNLFRIANENTTILDSFKIADNVLHSGVRGITDLMMAPGLINLDFADVRTILRETGKAMMGTGEADGENRAIVAAENAISNPLLDKTSMEGASGVLINITGGSDMSLYQVDAVANRIKKEVDEDANIIFGAAFDENLEGKIRVSVIATGIESRSSKGAKYDNEPIRINTGPRLELNEEENDNDEAQNQRNIDGGFVPSKPVEPSLYDIGNELSSKTASLKGFIKEEDDDEQDAEDEEEEKPSEGINQEDPTNGKKQIPQAQNFLEDELEEIKETATKQLNKEKPKSDFLDIPAFIRRKMRL